MMRKLIVGLVAVAALLTAACGQSGQPAHHASTPGPKSSASLAPARQVPVRLQIPSISVDSSVEQVGVDKSGNMDVPKQLGDVAWYSPGVVPGQPGDAVIAGHKDSDAGAPAVFWSLTKVKQGDDLVVVGQDGTKLKFKVTQIQTVAYNADTSKLGLFTTSGPVRLTLITCTGQVNAQRNGYLQRLIVDASYQGKA